jgi:anti-sigma factor RsiW
MHGSIRGGLEDLLSGKGPPARTEGLNEHLHSCGECSAELNTMSAHAALLRSLRAPDDAEPGAGFYARVMQRIEEHAKDSIWAIFVYSPFGKRLTFASLALAVMLGSYVIAQESRDGHLLADSMIAGQTLQYAVPVQCSPAQQRDAVLENFASLRGNVR